MTRPATSASAEALRALHRPGDPLVLPNAWDVTSARLIEKAGFPVVATSSKATLEALGLEDGGAASPAEAFAAVARIGGAVTVPVSADVEDGYGLDADTLVAHLIEVGASGCNIEDSDLQAGGLVDIEAQSRRIEDVKRAARVAGVDLVVNARIDTFLRGDGDPASRFDDALRRARAYGSCGADCVYPIRISDDAMISRFVDELEVPVNIGSRLTRARVAQLAEMGVARISSGPTFAGVAYAAASDAAAALRSTAA